MSELPEGTITFLFTDIEGSTTRWERYPDSMRSAIARHDALLQDVMRRHNGAVFKTVGDAFYVAFQTAGEALFAAIEAQCLLAVETWTSEIAPLRVRMALHTGEAELRAHDYFGQTLNRVARILSTGHGGQILLSQTVQGLIRDILPPTVYIRDMGKHRLKDILQSEQIFQLVIQDLPSEFSPLKTLDQHPNNLPTQLTPFVGRTRELHDVSMLLAQGHIRLITLTGPGGTGKTSLSIQIAMNCIETFVNGIYFVELASAYDEDAVILAIAQVLRIREDPHHDKIEAIKERLQGTVLLVLDNFEQVINASPVLLQLLLVCSDLKILVSSRELLRISGEYEYYIEPLTFPDVHSTLTLDDLLHYEAIVLFVQQAKAIKPDFALNAVNASAIVWICAQLDGLPLAIELAAARINLLTPQAMRKRLGRRLPLLTGGARNRSARQQTLRGAITWSYELLEQPEKDLLNRLAIFSGGCTLEAIEAVCGEIDNYDINLWDLLRSLIDKSLLRQRELENGESRFKMLGLIHEYALECLQETADIATTQDRHADYYFSFVEQAAAQLTGPEQKQWLARLLEEYENILSALSWLYKCGKIEHGLVFVEMLWHFWWTCGYLEEGSKWFGRFLEADENKPVSKRVRARALRRASILLSRQHNYASAVLLAEEALTLAQEIQDKETIVGSYIALADAAMWRKDIEKAHKLLEKCLVLQRDLHNERGTASLLNNLGNVALQQGKLDEAASFHRESLALFREIGDEGAIASVLLNLGEIEQYYGNYDHAINLYEESKRLCLDIGYTWGLASSFVALGNIARILHNYHNAIGFYQESITLFERRGDQVGIANCLEGLAQVAFAQEQLTLSTHFIAHVEIIQRRFGVTWTKVEEEAHKNVKDAIQELIGDNDFRALWDGEKSMNIEQVIQEALSMKIE